METLHEPGQRHQFRLDLGTARLGDLIGVARIGDGGQDGDDGDRDQQFDQREAG
jgi:hypothetical protein